MDLPKYSCSSSFSICSSIAFVSSSIFFSASLGPVGFGGVTLNGNSGGGTNAAAAAEAAAASADDDDATIGDDVTVRNGDNDALEDNGSGAAA